jgi:hypothetical protein
MKKYLLFVIIVASSLISDGQERISADRPDQTEGATLVPSHYFQAEFGFGAENIDKENFNIISPSLFKYGVSKRFEVQLLEKFISVHEQMIPQAKTTAGFVPLTIGFRTNLCEEKKIVPKTSLIVRMGVPALTSKSFKPDHAVPSFLLAMEKTVTEQLGLSSNIGAVWDGFSSKPACVYSLSAGFSLGKRWDAFLEPFGAAQENETAHNYLDSGFGFYVNNNMKLDAYLGFGISEAALNNFFGIGASFRFH